MHLPDGFISPPVAVVTGLASVAAVAVSLTRCRQAYGIRQAPVLGLTTAFVFAAQMVNFPVAGGTSGHLLGGTLAAVVLKSPWAGTLCITTVLIIQAVLFADGGITALGANALNMAVIGVWVGWGLTQVLHRILGGAKARLPLAAGIAAGISVVAAAIACAIELVLSGTAPANLVLPAMSGIHVLIGIGEGLITGGILTYLQKTQPDLLLKEQPQLENWLIVVSSIFLIAGVLSLLASAWPDGLEKVAEELGFIQLAENARITVPTPFADYELQGWGKIGTSITGIVGSALSFAMAFGIAQLAKPKNA
ncbi:MAG: PDGLE domain-containing protein [Oscillatoriaceae bacterium SKW80]|nr:PDGLE domain-containing protein [Oscillatoriaceae bacterium SKYG93]MCX8121491.1 PDGLE domain-containing protein [Oscillatoriaceae bacterium SKW80]MDW8452923.1 energy-coupling factor ABC transporter permease [Oscillatoriaceae cyanobacterium SKYGB_i_bin93]HIK27836.1 PDGLE domain-containing protein [Oscillatoriaceae cyanobacterium M7585_C2015_266]